MTSLKTISITCFFEVVCNFVHFSQSGSVWLQAVRGLWLWVIWGAHVWVSSCAHPTSHQVVQTTEGQKQGAEEYEMWVWKQNTLTQFIVHKCELNINTPLCSSKALRTQRNSQWASGSDLDGSQWGSRSIGEEPRALPVPAGSWARPQTCGDHQDRSACSVSHSEYFTSSAIS